MIKNYIRNILMLLILTVIAGCSAFGSPVTKASKNLDIKSKEFNPPSEWAAIYVMRPYQFLAAGVPIVVYLDHEKFGELPVGTYIYGEIKPREHIIELTGIKGTRNTTFRFKAEAGNNYFFNAEAHHTLRIEAISSDKGKKLVDKYQLSGQNKFDSNEDELNIVK